MSSHEMMRHGRWTRLAAVALTVIAVAVLAMTQRASGAPDPAKWCADYIRIDTQVGIMKNKRVIPSSEQTLTQFKRWFEAMLSIRAVLLAETPHEIRNAMEHYYIYAARLQASHYVWTTKRSPFTDADDNQVVTYEKAHCGITFS
jgi:hypothetical protein